MPLPFIPIAAALSLGSALVGTKKAHDARKTNAQAASLNRRLDYYINKARSSLEMSQGECQKSLETLKNAKLRAMNDGIGQFALFYEKIHNVDLCDSVGIQELSRFNITREELASMEKMGKLVDGNAIMGWLVGGVGLLGFAMNANAQANLERARANKAETEKYMEQCETAVALCKSIKARSDLLCGALDKQMSQLKDDVLMLARLVKCYDDGSGYADYRRFSADEKKSVAKACALAKDIKQIIDTPVLTENGQLTRESEVVAKKLATKAK